MLDAALLFVGGAVLSFLIGTLFEYWVHRLMHWRIFKGRIHTQHHKEGWGQGWLGEFIDYFHKGALPAILMLLVLFWWIGLQPIGIGLAVGGMFYCALAAYAHQAQHEYPELTFWMRRPVHYLHHEHHMWHHNFGITVDVWDRVFGTYQRVEWTPARRFRDLGWRDFVRIKWV